MRRFFWAIVAFAIHPICAALAQQADAERGRTLFQRQCSVCHQIASPRNGAGPTLQGMLGRAAGAVEGFSYSPALNDSGIVWSPETLDAFLANPVAMVPGNRMTLRVANDAQRRDIIEFLVSAEEE